MKRLIALVALLTVNPPKWQDPAVKQFAEDNLRTAFAKLARADVLRMSKMDGVIVISACDRQESGGEDKPDSVYAEEIKDEVEAKLRSAGIVVGGSSDIAKPGYPLLMINVTILHNGAFAATAGLSVNEGARITRNNMYGNFDTWKTGSVLLAADKGQIDRGIYDSFAMFADEFINIYYKGNPKK